MTKKPLWSPDLYDEFHLGDLMYNIEEAKRKEKEKSDGKADQQKEDKDD